MNWIRVFFKENTSPLSNLFRVNEVNDNKKWRPNCYLYPCVYSLLPGAMTKIFFVYDFYIILWSKNSVFVCLFFVVKNYVKKKILYTIYISQLTYIRWNEFFLKYCILPYIIYLYLHNYTYIQICHGFFSIFEEKVKKQNFNLKRRRKKNMFMWDVIVKIL